MGEKKDFDSRWQLSLNNMRWRWPMDGLKKDFDFNHYVRQQLLTDP
jgi:hypothetical protein